MRYREITKSKPVARTAPLPPTQTTKRVARIDNSLDKLADAQAAFTLKKNTAKRK